MTKFCHALFGACLVGCLLLVASGRALAEKAGAPKEEVLWIKIEGPIGPRQSRAIRRLYERVDEKHMKTVILELDTPGGLIMDSFDIADTIYRHDQVTTIAYVTSMALSGGTIVALACNEIYMLPGSQIGDVAPIDPSQRGVILGEKVQTPVRSKLRTFAKARGYPVALTDAMVTKELEVFKVKFQGDPKVRYMSREEINNLPEAALKQIVDKQLVVAAGKLLTMDAGEAEQFGFARKIKDRAQLLQRLGITEDQIEQRAGSRLGLGLKILNTLAPVLLAAGLVLLFFEFATPGFAVPGILGVTLLVTVFITKSIVGTASTGEILLFVIGLGLVAVDVFVTAGFGLIGIPGILCVIIGLVLSFQDFGWPKNDAQWHTFGLNIIQVLGSLVMTVVVIGVVARYVVRVPLFNRLVLTRDLSAATINSGAPGVEDRRSGLAGKVGTAVTPLRPSGRILIDGDVFDAVTDGEFVANGSPVKVLAVEGMRIVVVTVPPEELESESASEQESDA